MKRIAKKNEIGLIIGKEYEIVKNPVDNFYYTYYTPYDHFAFQKCELDTFFEPKQKKDKVVSQVLNKFKERSKIGIKKYGTTLHENELTIPEWINHAIEEQMDNILYLTKLKNELSKKK
jgi:hypothetical protein